VQVVTSFPQEHLDPEHDPVEGMLGMELLGLFDADLDFPAGRLRLWAPGSAAAVARAAGLVEVPAAVLNETGLLGVRVTSPDAPAGQPLQPFVSGGRAAPAPAAPRRRGGCQPAACCRPRCAPDPPPSPLQVGIIDCGASFSALNWGAAALAGLPPRSDQAAWGAGPKIFSVGVDGRPLPLPTASVRLTYVGDPLGGKGAGGALSFAPPAEGWRPWEPVGLAVGDLPVFSQLLGDGVKPFAGPAALIGLDVLRQRRVILEAGAAGQGRRRRLFVAPR
jgi:hypothetical protein